MTDLHERLLARLDDLSGWTIGDDGMAGPVNFARDYGQAVGALRAVVERHTPGEIVTIGDKGKVVATRPWCPWCRTSSPCEETKAIARALGVEIEETP